MSDSSKFDEFVMNSKLYGYELAKAAWNDRTDKARQLASIAIVFRNHNTMEFGVNEYLDKKLIDALTALGIKTTWIDEEFFDIENHDNS